MQRRILVWDGTDRPQPSDDVGALLAAVPAAGGWAWLDILIEPGDSDDHPWVASLGLDPIALHDALHDVDIPKVDDFVDQMLIVLHGLSDDRVETYEVDCFVMPHLVVTFHPVLSPAIESLWHGVQAHPELEVSGPSDLAGRLADGLTRRLLAVVDAFDGRTDELISQALVADSGTLADVMAVRSDLSKIRRVVIPQREALDLLRTSDSPLITAAARRRFSDVFDVASRAATGLDAARTALAETLDAYRGAEARAATEVSKVLTVYAAVLLPLSLIVGFFGMNHQNLPTIDSKWGWLVVAAGMAAVAAVSIGVFVAEGWVRRPSGRRAGAKLGRGLLEAARAPAQVAGAVFEISSMPLRTAITRRSGPRNDD
ncbi:MAG TPA: magnesium transporter CorA family protein [Ilumatobacter sp.]